MRKLCLAMSCLMFIGSVQAQTLSEETVDQFKEVSDWMGQPYSTCNEQLEGWGFDYNKEGVVDLFAMVSHPYQRKEGDDTVGVVLGVIDGVVYSVGSVYRSIDASRTYALIAQAAAWQQKLADERGLMKFVCSVKGDVGNRFPKNAEELAAVLAEAKAGTVGKVYATWKVGDGRQTLSLVYDDRVTGRKKPKARNRAELTVGMGETPERR